MKTTCPHCGEHYDIPTAQVTEEYARIMGRRTSEAKSAAARENGKKGGRPPIKKQAPV